MQAMACIFFVKKINLCLIFEHIFFVYAYLFSYFFLKTKGGFCAPKSRRRTTFMGKFIYTIISFMLCGFLAFPVYAAEDATVTATQTEKNTSKNEDTTDDGNLSEDASEEISIVEEGDNIKSISEQEGDRTGVVTFVMDVPSTVTDPCVILFTSVDSYEEYYAKAYKSAGYKVTAYLEPGTYMITDGYPVGDNVSAYSVQDKGYFIVEEGGQQEVDVTIRSKGDIIRQAAEKEVETSTAVTTEEQETEEIVEKEPLSRKYYAVMAIILLTLGTGLIYGLYKVLKKKEKS